MNLNGSLVMSNSIEGVLVFAIKLNSASIRSVVG